MSRIFQLEKYNKEFLLGLLEEMVLMRRFEEKAGQMYGLQKIGGFCHLYIGQEAVATGSIAAVDLTKDYVLTTYRDHGHALSCGMDPGVLMAELYGKVTGCSKGKGGSMHLFDKEKHMYGGHGIVGSHIPLAVGIALKIKYKEEDGVVLCYFGDGAIHQGAFHESLNMAKVWNLPVVFICENNQYGMGTNFERVSSVHDFYIMGDSYGIPGKQVDGMNVLEVYEETLEAAKRARDKGIPSFLEVKTYRYKGHSMSDPGRYRTREELDEYRNQDPITLLRDAMVEHNLITEDEYKAIDQQAKIESNRAVEFAENSEEPDLAALYEDILV
ncbi:MAG: pyruvate dehydrogenase (acetyl-transferring) E1 component subunit alpha [Clostridiales bacterium]|nr:pyruvate dehydrogenase (acetyl-transferring) E1 component subunit alpha [Clostridiales bacterium]